MSQGAVAHVQRFTRVFPCPICGGGKDDPKGRGKRCAGFLSSDARFARCTREEFAGELSLDLDTDPPTFLHFLEGECQCGRSHGMARSVEVAAYDYVDPNGDLLYQAVRYTPKDFRQRRPDGSGGWINNLQGVERVLYRLPRVLEAIAAGETIYVVEGEKDVHAVERAGAVATCNAMGAGKWRPAYADALAGARRVVVVADNDPVGLAHAQTAVSSLQGRVDQVELRVSAQGRDVSDHLAALHTLDELIPYVGALNGDAGSETARPWHSETWAEFRDTSDEDTRWLVHGLIPEGQLAFTAAPPKKGKTWIAIGKALSVASGKPLFGEYAVTAPTRVLYVALEGSRSALRARIGALARGMGIDPDDPIENLLMLYRPRPFDLAQLASAEWLHEEVDEHGARYVIIDVLRAAARIQEKDASDFAKVRDSLEPMLVQGITVDLLHHFGKLTDTLKDRTPGERMSGTGAMYGALDVGFYITRSENGARRLRIELEARDFATPEAIGVVIQGTGSGEHGGFTYRDTATLMIDASAAEERDLVTEVEELLADGEWRTVDEIRKELKANKDEVRDMLKASPERFAQVDAKAVGQHYNRKPWGTIAMAESVWLSTPSHTSHTSENEASQSGFIRVAHPTGETTSSHTNDSSGSGSRATSDPTLLEDDDGIPF